MKANEKINKKLFKAVVKYYARKERITHPNGYFDRAKRWYPSEGEEQNCCGGLRRPTRSFPNSLNTHCRSVKHIAQLLEVDAKELRRLVKQFAPIFSSTQMVRLIYNWFSGWEIENTRKRLVPLTAIKGFVLEKSFQ